MEVGWLFWLHKTYHGEVSHCFYEALLRVQAYIGSGLYVGHCRFSASNAPGAVDGYPCMGDKRVTSNILAKDVTNMDAWTQSDIDDGFW